MKILQTKTIFFLLTLVCGVFSAAAQHEHEKCATHTHHKQLQEKGLMPSDDAFEGWISRKMAEMPPSNKRQVITIPVVVHIIHNETQIGREENITEAQVLSQMRVLNEDFRRKPGSLGFNSDVRGADTEIEFCLARFDRDGNPFNGINRIQREKDAWTRTEWETFLKPTTIWDPTKYYNVWLSKNFGDAGSSSILIGYAQFPVGSGLEGLPGAGAGDTDGIVLRADFFGSALDNDGTFYVNSRSRGRTLTHETGHWLGLRHIWGDTNCGNDYCADTPTQASPSSGCQVGRVSCDAVNMVENYMDYSDDICMNIFTECQKQRMQTVLVNSPRRKELVTSALCDGPPVVKFSATATKTCPNSVIQFRDLSGVSPNAWEWKFEGGTPATSTEQNPFVSYAAAGVYDVILKAFNDNGFSIDTLEDFITVSNTIKERIYLEDFEAGFNGWQVTNPDGKITWDTIRVQGDIFNGQKAIYVKNFQQQATIGQRDFITSPNISAAYGRSGARLKLDYAYRQSTNSRTDSLIISISKDAGATFKRIYANGENGSNSFITDVLIDGNFIPDRKRNWCHSSPYGARCLDIDLAAYEGEPNIMFRFESFSNNGNNLFIDNISIEANCVSGSVKPLAQFSADRTYACANLIANFYDKSLANPTAWEWTFEGGTPATSTQRNPSVTYSVAGSYKVKLKASNANGDHTTEIDNFVLVSDETPLADFSFERQNTKVTFTNLSTDAARYEWSFGDGKSSADKSPIHYYPDAGNYTVRLKASNGCGENIKQQSLTLTPTHDPKFVEELTIAPNPTDAVFEVQLRTKTLTREIEILVTDILGRVVHHAKRNLNNYVLTEKIDLTTKPAGTYFVQLRAGKEVANRKVTLF